MRNLMVLIISSFVFVTNMSNATEINFAKIGKQSRLENIPIMILFIDNDCDNCTAVNKEFVTPMQISGEYTDKAIIQIVNLDEDNVLDFNSKKVRLHEFVDFYHLELTPTASFVDSAGKELVPSISGVSNLEYYGSLLDESIEKALSKVGNQ